MKITNNNGKYVANDRGIQIEGTWDQVSKVLVDTYGFEQDELNAAKAVMKHHKHDTADFGLNGFLIMTYSSNGVENMLSELEAIQTARQIFNEEHSVNPESQQTKAAYDRLMYLYFALNVDALVRHVRTPEDKVA